MILQSRSPKWFGYQGNFGGGLEEPRIELISIDVLELQSRRVETWLFLVNIAYAMRRQVDLAILLVWQLEFAFNS